MARERMVTRTVLVTKVQVICLNVEKVETKIETYELSGVYTSTEQVLKALKKLHETETFKLVAVQELVENEVLYGIPEAEFIKIAKVLPPRGTKASDDNDTVEE